MSFKNVAKAVSALAVVALSGCLSQTTMGTDQGPVTGSAGPGGASENASSQLERCERPLGVLTLIESQDVGMSQSLSALGLGSPVPVLRLIAQQSKCFIIADRGQAMQAIQQERALSQAGEMRAGGNMGGGQLVAADLALTPTVLFQGNTGGGVAALGGLIPGVGGILASAVASSLKFTSAQTMLAVTDIRSGIQISSAEGTATARDIGIGGGLFGGMAGGSVGAYGNTPEGKVIAAALMDAFNKVVRSVREMPPLPSVALQAQAPRWLANGNLVLRESPGKGSEALGRLAPGTEVNPTGREKEGWIEVKSGDSVGWVAKKNIRRQ
ncbi:SH3 domain-containing protein [Magnetospirillum fulvum]|uniref:Curli production assembly/transport component CsgG n=1 Tax=Magnetospirillum fulvum TaxID=1082 RepID=A0A1H6HAD8_MAGFU|nr:SH3 domain-containing protein [Magnetospirillum fulvum]SEH31060.1 Curli production assembly/transport component CsgG [Magnetospirillum fulvum]